MSEKIRGAIFNALGDISDLTVLDAFTGSGALCFEAVSRGVANATGIDVDKGAITTAVKSAKDLGVENIQFVRSSAAGWSDNNPESKFDIVLLDPPYDDVKPNLLSKMADHCKTGGVLVISLPPNIAEHELEGFEKLISKDYGDATLGFYRAV